MREFGDKETLANARKIFAARLSAEHGTWTISGERIDGPGTVAVLLEKRHDGSPSHLEIGTILDRDKPGAPVLWTCTSGFGDDLDASLKNAVESWVLTTLPVIKEVFSQDGANADQFGPDTPGGCPGWHVIQGPWSGMDQGDGGGKALSRWAVDHKLLAELGPIVTPAFPRADLNMVKVMIVRGKDEIAEVRVNGEKHDPASWKLAAMGWPRGDWALVRCTMLFMHPDGWAADGSKSVTLLTGPPPAPPPPPAEPSTPPNPVVIFSIMIVVVAVIAAGLAIRALMGKR